MPLLDYLGHPNRAAERQALCPEQAAPVKQAEQPPEGLGWFTKAFGFFHQSPGG